LNLNISGVQSESLLWDHSSIRQNLIEDTLTVVSDLNDVQSHNLQTEIENDDFEYVTRKYKYFFYK